MGRLPTTKKQLVQASLTLSSFYSLRSYVHIAYTINMDQVKLAVGQLTRRSDLPTLQQPPSNTQHRQASSLCTWRVCNSQSSANNDNLCRSLYAYFLDLELYICMYTLKELIVDNTVSLYQRITSSRKFCGFQFLHTTTYAEFVYGYFLTWSCKCVCTH